MCSAVQRKNSWVKRKNALCSKKKRKKIEKSDCSPSDFLTCNSLSLSSSLTVQLESTWRRGEVNEHTGMSSFHNSWKAWVGRFIFNACTHLIREGVWVGDVILVEREGGACGSCKMPTGSHYTWVLSVSFRAPKTFLPLNGAFGKREVHWNHKQTQERERKSERMKERK